MKKIFCILLILSVAVSAFSQTITIGGKAPTTGTGDSFADNALQDAFDGLRSQLEDMVGGLDLTPKNLIRAFGNASVYSSQGATQRGYGGYNTFAVTFGSTIGFQLPVSPFKVMDLLSGDPLKRAFDDGDLIFGLNPQVINAQIGFNTSFLLKDLYLGLRIGFTPDLGNMMGDIVGGMGGMNFSFSNFLLGITANYQLVESKSIGGLITWRGVNLGSGLLFQTTKLNMTYPFTPITQEVEGYTNTYLKIDPKIFFNMDITTFTIPLEVMTAVNLVFLNIPFGIGVDFAFGKSSMDIGMHSDISITSNLFSNATPGYLTIDAGGAMAPTFANLKLMTGIGISIGPAIVIDIPVTWYFLDNGLNIGITAGLTF
jgi:hypothetical protein